MTITQTRPQFLTEALIEVLNNEWKVSSIESGRSVYTQLEYEVGRKTSKFGLIFLMMVTEWRTFLLDVR